MNLLHVQNPQAFRVQSFQEFMLRALSTDPFVFALDALVELSRSMFNPNIGVFVTVDDTQYRGVAVVGNSTTPLSPGCVVLHFYNEGADAESRNLLISAISKFAKLHGCSKIRGIDINGGGPAFAKLFKALGPATERGRVYEFDISEGASSE